MDYCSYSPQISPGNPNITPMPALNPLTIVNRSTVLFQYPYDTPTLTLELRNPQLNDQKTIDLSRIQRHSRGRELITYRDPDWPAGYTLSMAFTSLSLQTKNQIISFVQQTVGREIKFTDHLSQIYKCIIANPRNFISEEYDVCGFTWKVDLQGVLVL